MAVTREATTSEAGQSVSKAPGVAGLQHAGPSAEALGADAFLIKPADPLGLLARLRELMTRERPP